MNETYIALIKDIDATIGKQFGRIKIAFPIFGYAALELAGLPERGTKDMDTLKTGVLTDSKNKEVVDLLTSEFGKRSPGEIRHGIYLDLVAENVPWLPHPPKFIKVRAFSHIIVSRLDPADVCVSKIFSFFKRLRRNNNDKNDILMALDHGLATLEKFISRTDEALLQYECHAEAPELFPKVLGFITNELLPRYNRTDLALKYDIPSWMENM